MRRDLEDVKVAPEVAGAAVGRDATTVRRWVRESRISNYGTARRIRVSLAEVLAEGEDVLGIF